MTNFPKEKDPILAEADNAQPDMEMVMYDGGGDDFQAIQNETAFDYKKLGAGIFRYSVAGQACPATDSNGCSKRNRTPNPESILLYPFL